MKSQLSPYVNPFPAPVILIGCGTVKKPNIITCSWFGTVASDPPTVSVSLRKSDSFLAIAVYVRHTVEVSVYSDFPRLSSEDRCQKTQRKQDTKEYSNDRGFFEITIKGISKGKQIHLRSLVFWGINEKSINY